MDSVILFGASKLGEEVFEKLKHDYKIEFFCDNNSNKWNKTLNGKLIIKPSDILKYKDCKVIISSSFIYSIGEQLDNMNVNEYYVYKDKQDGKYELIKIANNDINKIFNKNEIYYISPKEINLQSKQSFDSFYDLGLILDGDWDENLITIDENNEFYFSFKEHLYNKIPWEDTQYFKRIVKKINLGEIKWGCTNEVEFLNKCEEWDSIFNDIKNNGYKQNQDSDYVNINIGRTGNIIFNDGLHRLIFAKILNLKQIPVKIIVRHKNWIDLKKEIKNYVQLNGQKLYAPINHLDLQNFECLHKNRFDNIIKNMDPSSKTILDIGAHWGYFDSVLEEKGKQCTAVELDANNIYFMNKIKKAKGQNFRVINGDIFEFAKTENQFDVVLALNIFHHFIKEEYLYNKLIELLNNLIVKEMFFETHRQDESQMVGSYINYSPQEFVEFILSNSNFCKYKEIGDFNGRKLYHLTK